MIHVCVVGTRERLSTVQYFWLYNELKYIDHMGEVTTQKIVLHHDDLNGTVKEAHEVALLKGWMIVAHPLLDDESRAHLERASKVLRKRAARDRIDYIARHCSIILAVPKTPLMKLDRDNTGPNSVAGAQSYTWMVVMAGLESGKDVRVCPTGDW